MGVALGALCCLFGIASQQIMAGINWQMIQKKGILGAYQGVWS